MQDVLPAYPVHFINSKDVGPSLDGLSFLEMQLTAPEIPTKGDRVTLNYDKDMPGYDGGIGQGPVPWEVSGTVNHVFERLDLRGGQANRVVYITLDTPNVT